MWHKDESGKGLMMSVRKRTQQIELKILGKWYSKTLLKWEDTLNIEIGKEETVSTGILIVTEERLLQSFTQKQNSSIREKLTYLRQQSKY